MLISIISILIMILIHEYGHFISARLLKIPVFEFSVGMGPLIYSKKGKKGTKYSFRLFPIGGYCSFDDGALESLSDMALNKQPIWKRIIVFFAGSFFNIISAIIIAICMSLFIGSPVQTTQIATIDSKDADSFLEKGDTILEVNGINVENDIVLLRNELSKSEKTADILIKRNGETKFTKIDLIKSGESYVLGVNMNISYEKTDVFTAVKNGINFSILSIEQVFNGLESLIKGSVKAKEMSGIVGVVSLMGNAINQNVFNLLSYFVLISINLGIFNLLPIPVLDGSKIVFCIYEFIFKKRIPEKVETNITLFFVAAFILFTIFITISDILKLI